VAGRASGIKIRYDGGGSLISPDRVVPSRVIGVSASVIFPCTIKSKRRFLLAAANPGSPRKRAIKRLCVFASLCLHFLPNLHYRYTTIITAESNEPQQILKVKVVGNYQPVRLLLCGGLERNCWELVAQIFQPLLHVLLCNQIFTHTITYRLGITHYGCKAINY